MGDPFRKVQPGDRLEIPAAAYNAFINAAVAHRQRMRLGPDRPLPARHRVLVKNTTGIPLSQFDVVGLGSPVIDPAQNESAFRQRVALAAESVTPPDHLGRFAILQQSLGVGAVGEALMAGVTPVRLQLVESWHRYAVPAGGQTYLQSQPVGPAEILWYGAESGGYYWAVVRVSGLPAEVCWVELQQALVAGGNASARVLKWNDGLGQYETGSKDVTVCDVAGLSASAGQRVPIAFGSQNGRLEVLAVPSGLACRLTGEAYSPENLLHSSQNVNIYWTSSDGDSLSAMGLEMPGAPDCLRSTSGGAYMIHLCAQLAPTDDWPTSDIEQRNTTYNAEPPDAHNHQYDFRRHWYLGAYVSAIGSGGGVPCFASGYLRYTDEGGMGDTLNASGLWLPSANDTLCVCASVQAQNVTPPAGAQFIQATLAVERIR